MAKTISIADDVYEWMKREKGEKSFSEVIRSLKEEQSNFTAVNGVGVADWDTAKQAIKDSSGEAWSKWIER